MFNKEDKIILRQIIMEHFTSPSNKGFLELSKGIFKNQDSASCSDEINVQIIFEDGKIVDSRFDGVACSISTASIDILCDQIRNKGKEEALIILYNYHNMISGKDYNEDILDELIAFWQIHHQGNRINCALLGADGLRYILENEVK